MSKLPAKKIGGGFVRARAPVIGGKSTAKIVGTYDLLLDICAGDSPLDNLVDTLAGQPLTALTNEEWAMVAPRSIKIGHQNFPRGAIKGSITFTRRIGFGALADDSGVT